MANPAVVSSSLAGKTLSAFYLHTRQLIILFILIGSDGLQSPVGVNYLCTADMYYIVIGQNNIVGAILNYFLSPFPSSKNANRVAKRHHFARRQKYSTLSGILWGASKLAVSWLKSRSAG